nr:kinesin-like protein KIN-12B [Tanacetum cinerariifolium]
MSGGVPPSESFFWVSFISENVLSFIDVAPLSLVQSYMDDVSIAVGDNEKLNEAIVEKECLFPYKERPKVGVYVHDLRNETICNMDDATQILKEGMSNRTAATRLNIQSFRSHNVFTCIVESQCKMDGLNCFKTSRMILVDLARTERQEATGATGERQKEARHINRSFTPLGNLSNILAEVSQTGKKRYIPYRDSKLRYLLQESLGGNAELAIVYAIFPHKEMKIVDEERKCCKELRGTADGHGRPSTSLNKDFDDFVRNFNMHCVGKTVTGIHTLLIDNEKGLKDKAPTPQDAVFTFEIRCRDLKRKGNCLMVNNICKWAMVHKQQLKPYECLI